MSAQEPPTSSGGYPSADGTFAHPQKIGPYHVLQVVGEGGMGVVYLAEQKVPVRRTVAVKMMKVGMDTKEVIGRFQAERQALAVMDHPSIARVLDAGATDSGRPYFVMEYVKGMPLREYCDSRHLSTRDRVALFVPICEAVQHAHQKGIIHRDLKPSNILVAEHESGPFPKIIDFGIAKATGQRLSEHTVVTLLGEVMGTPAYMSPEQAEMSGLDVDTRTDIYSLGVILYEVLVGALPVDPQVIGLQSFIAQLLMRETDPPTPSSRAATLAARRADAPPQGRRGDPRPLHLELRGDLDWIVMRAMDKDRTRRYETANGLAMDLRRYLQDEPVVARPPSAGYRARKFVRRNRTGVIAAALIAIALAAGTVLATMGFMRATRAQRAATREALAAREVSDFLVNLFRVADPGEARGSTITAREILQVGARRIQSDLGTQPAVQARLLATIGDVYTALGLYGDAVPLLEQAVTVQNDARAPERERPLWQYLDELGDAYRLQARYDTAKRVYQRALDLRRRTADPQGVEVARSYLNLANVFIEKKEFGPADSMLAEAGARIGRDGATSDTLRARLYGQQGIVAQERGDYAAAEEHYRDALTLEAGLFGTGHPSLLGTMQQLAVNLYFQGKYAEADTAMRNVAALQERVLGPRHAAVAATLSNVGAVNFMLGHYDDAERFYRRALDVGEEVYGPDHPDVATFLFNIGEVLWKRGKSDDAERQFRRSLRIKEERFGADNPTVAFPVQGLANVARDRGRFAEAERLYRRALAIREESLGPGHPAVAETLTEYAVLLRETGREAAADSADARAAAIRAELR